MEDLITRVAGAAGIDNGLASKAVGLILGFLQKEGPAEPVQQMLAALPGSTELIDQASGGGGGLMGMVGGMMGGGIMGLGANLMGAGLDMGQISTVGKELVAFGREHAGEDVMGQIVGGTPGLSQFV
ncbi:DUF2267 domain-containing protein [Phreatobacter stygius]|uniref:DUF2267 domain-containing protein n=1 Tax=Phreatobacter stygius TaxID=1940610 RepID=A0A4D7B7W1_9HYPH|nr:DUF2267 domain-containing protein [Phreatobacter stygius]QCI69334.1 DUF2267 domain-containing protein [Phreatobacter stygius]